MHEPNVIGTTVSHALTSWRQRELRLYVGCYRNDPDTIAAAIAGGGGDDRLRLVIHDRSGPTTKADCLNRLYAAVRADEDRGAAPFRCLILQDAEDMVHPDALAVIDRALANAEFVQLPVRPALQAHSRWVAGHYADEFTEAHGKALAVRGALKASLPAAGVGCGFDRETIHRLAQWRMIGGEEGPFAADCLTEDYELGLLISRLGGRSVFLRTRDLDGELVATRSYFPDSLRAAVTQKQRWIHGIAFQGWDRLGWPGRPVELWMALRDRRGPLTAVVLLAAYLLLAIEGVLAAAHWAGSLPLVADPISALALSLAFVALLWRVAMRFAFTTREYGLAEGLRSTIRIVLANVIAIMAARRAISAYLRSMLHGRVVWDKTAHLQHPALAERLGSA